MKLGKSAGIDEITPEMLKYMGSEGTKIMLHLLNLLWNQKKIPRDWKVALIVPIFKKGDNRACNNHRRISLRSLPGKVYARIIENRIRRIVENTLQEEQFPP